MDQYSGIGSVGFINEKRPRGKSRPWIDSRTKRQINYVLETRFRMEA